MPQILDIVAPNARITFFDYLTNEVQCLISFVSNFYPKIFTYGTSQK